MSKNCFNFYLQCLARLSDRKKSSLRGKFPSLVVFLIDNFWKFNVEGKSSLYFAKFYKFWRAVFEALFKGPFWRVRTFLYGNLHIIWNHRNAKISEHSIFFNYWTKICFFNSFFSRMLSDFVNAFALKWYEVRRLKIHLASKFCTEVSALLFKNSPQINFVWWRASYHFKA